MNRRLLLSVIAGIAAVFIALLLLKQCGHKPQISPPVISEPIKTSTATFANPVAPSVVPTPKVEVKPKVEKATPSQPSMAPPPVQIFKELIPKNIEIVRVYYANLITGPASSLEFDINGSGFTKEFEKMITVESGQPEALVKNLALITPNQIHGTLQISEKSTTMVAFPRVLIGGKVVFQAPDPFAVIRPGEVLNLLFTEMGESGRSGRFRAFTNLTQETYSKFKVTVSTPVIQISELSPSLPFIVDGTINIGPAAGGEYDIAITLDDKVIWKKEKIIRVVRPNVGQSGLIQRVAPHDEFRRPGDKVYFAIQGSGFQREDVDIIQASVKGVEIIQSCFTYVSPGRLELQLELPKSIEPKVYGLTLTAENEVLQDISRAFQIVGKNWPRLLKVSPELKAGGTSTLSLIGRDFDQDFVSKFKVEVDEPELKIGSFQWTSPEEASAPISAGINVKPGDYLIRITSDGKPVNPEMGSIIRVSK